MTPSGTPPTGATDLMALPDLTLDPVMLRDVEAGLLGLLAEGHRLGGQVRPGPAGRRVVLAADGLGPADAAGPGLLLRDHEHTPVAALTDLAPEESGTVRGDLVAVRRRESGEYAELALQTEDLAAMSGSLVVLDRPPVDLDTTAVEPLLAADGDLWVVVPDSPGAPVPLGVLVTTARAWLGSIGTPDRSEGPAGTTYRLSSGGTAYLRTAPLAWRDAGSDRTLLRRLTDASRATQVLVLGADGDTPAGRQWATVSTQLTRGDGASLAGVSAPVGAALLRWRPARATRGVAIMFTGFSGSGKSTVARDVSDWIRDHSTRRTTLLDGDLVRQMLSSGLGFDRAGRIANVRRIGYVAAEIARHGGIAICSPIAPYEQTRAEVREMVEAVGDFFLVHVNTPLEECEKRDLKGLYAKARAGVVPEFTGISDPYDVPEDADLRVDTSQLTREQALHTVITALQRGGWLEGNTA